MGGRTVFRFGLALILAVVGLATLFGLLGIAQEQVYAAPFQPVSQSLVGRGAPRFAPPPGPARAPAASPPVAPLRNGGGSTAVITVCEMISVCPYTSVQEAVIDIPPGGAVKVAQGVYNDVHDIDGHAQVVYITKALTLRGGYTTTDWTISRPDVYRTVLDGGDSARVVHIADGIAPVVEGFHIRNGSDTDCGGLYIAGDTPVVQRNRIYGNAATGHGSGLCVAGGSPTLQNNLIYSNTSSGQGAGVWIGGGSPVIWYNTFYDNRTSQEGGGLYIVSGSPVISANIIVSNVASSGGGIYNEGGDTGVLGYNDVVSNTGGDYVGLVAPGDTVHADPLFMNQAAADLAEVNFRLRPGSPCIGEGDPNHYPGDDYDGYARSFGVRPDIGAHEFYTGTCFVRVNSSRVYTTVQEAMDVAEDSNEVKVAGYCAGVALRGGKNQVVYINNQDVALRGGYTLTNWSIPDWDTYSTTLDALEQGRVVYVVDSAVTVEGLDIRRGRLDEVGGGICVEGGDVLIQHNRIYSNSAINTGGGGIYLRSYSGNPAMRHNQIYSNVAVGGNGLGGGIYVEGNPAIEDNWIHHNSGDKGGGIFIWEGGPTVQRNQIYTNTAREMGGGIYIRSGSSEIGHNDIYSNAATHNGGGICIEAASPTVEENEIYGNRTSTNNATSGGGGIYISGHSPVVRNNRISTNTVAGSSSGGGGIYIYAAAGPQPVIEGNKIYHNSAGEGGGVQARPVHADGYIFVRNNLVYSNTASHDGGGILVAGANCTLESNTIYDNLATNNGGGICCGEPYVVSNTIVVSNVALNTGGGIWAGAGTVLAYNDMWGNTGGNYNSGVTTPTTDISADPLFEDPPGANFHLQANSPCRDAADPNNYPTYDYDGYVRPFGPRADIGAYEFYAGACFARLSTGGQVYTTVQAAVYTATSGAEVRVAGLCQGTVTISQPLAMRGGYTITDWTTPITPAILDGGGQGPVVTITGTGTVTVEQLVIRGGNAITGAGLYVATPLSPTIRNVVFHGNTAQYGGGLASAGGNPRLYNNTFVTNTATVTGGGLCIAAGGPVISNTIVVSNAKGGIYAAVGATPTLAYNDVCCNDGEDYAGNLDAGEHDIEEDPQFKDFFNADFHLQPESPCVNAGDPGTELARDFEGDDRPRPPGDGYDIGADEATEYRGVLWGLDQGGETFPGDVITYTHRLTNVGTQEDTFFLADRLEVVGGGTGWQWGYLSVYTLSPGVGTAVPVTIHVPGDAVSGTQATLFLTATSQASLYFFDVTSNTTTVKRDWGALLEPPHTQSANPGDVITYVHTLTNTGNVPDTFDIDIFSSLGWAERSPAQVTLDSEASASIYVTITVPSSAPGGIVDTTFVTATSTTDPKSEPAHSAVSDATAVNYTAGPRHVATWGSDTLNSCLDSFVPCRTIGHAVGQAVGGDVIKVEEGVYDEYDLTLNKTVELQGSYTDTFSVQNPDAHSSIIDAGELGRVLKIYGNPTVEGFTLRDGKTDGSGGGVYVGSGTPTLRRNLITGNSAVRHGGGVYNTANLRLERNILAGNTASRDGGGFYNASGNPVVQYNVFRDNMAEGSGAYAGRGGGFYNGSGSPSAWTNVFHDNVADDEGGGFYDSANSPQVLHGTFYSNTASAGGGIYLLAGGSPIVSNTIVVSNTGGGIHGTAVITVDYNDVFGNAGGDYGGSIASGDNSLAEAPMFRDVAGRDFRLRKGSPCIDEGDETGGALAQDMEGQWRWMGDWPDIGADEFQEAGVQLVPLVDKGSGEPGHPVTYTYALTNTGNYTDDFQLTWWNQRTGEGWTVTVGGSSAQPVTVTLGMGVMEPVQVVVHIPSGVPSTTVNTTIVTATSTVDTDRFASATVTTTVKRAVLVSLEPDRTGWELAGGPSVVYTHTLTNMGNYPDTFNLQVESSWTTPGGSWSPATVSTDTVYLVGGASTVITVTVIVPPDANATEVHTAIVTATSDTDSGVHDSVTDITVAGPFGVSLWDDEEGNGQPGVNVLYTHVLSNAGHYTDTFDITSSASRGWPTTISPVPAVQLAMGLTTTVQVTVTIPATALGGDVDVRVITATSQSDGTVYDTVVETTTVPWITAVSLVPLPPHVVNVWAVTTQTLVHEYRLSNQGNNTDTFALTVSSAQGWPVQVWPQVVGPLGRGTPATTVYVTHTVPPHDPRPYPAPVDSVVVTATSHHDPAVYARADDDTVIVNQYANVEVSPGDPDPGWGQPGQWVAFTHTLTNTGNYKDIFDTYWINEHGESVRYLPAFIDDLEPMTPYTFTFEVRTPSLGCYGSSWSFITATSRYSNTFSDGAMDTIEILPVYSVALGPQYTILVTSSDASEVVVTRTHWVTNTGNCTNTFDLGVQHSPLFTPTGVVPASTSELPANGSAPVILTVTVPATGTGNLLVSTAVVTAGGEVGKGGFGSATDTIIVNQLVDVAFVPNDTGIITQPTGGTVVYTHTLTNNGNYTAGGVGAGFQVLCDGHGPGVGAPAGPIHHHQLDGGHRYLSHSGDGDGRVHADGHGGEHDDGAAAPRDPGTRTRLFPLDRGPWHDHHLLPHADQHWRSDGHLPY